MSTNKQQSSALLSSASLAPAKKVSVAVAKKIAVTPVEKAAKPKSEKTASKQSPSKISPGNATISPEVRYQMIATAAYFRAEQRGFTHGYEMEDWISGEAQIDDMLNA